MNIIINNTSMQPIYEQIVEQVKNMILSGRLREQDALPSVRALAKDLKISALTVKKAYDTLESDGFVITIHGKGSYIAATNVELVLEEQRRTAERDFERAVRSARSCGMRDDEVIELVKLILEE